MNEQQPEVSACIALTNLLTIFSLTGDMGEWTTLTGLLNGAANLLARKSYPASWLNDLEQLSHNLVDELALDQAQ